MLTPVILAICSSQDLNSNIKCKDSEGSQIEPCHADNPEGEEEQHQYAFYNRSIIKYTVSLPKNIWNALKPVTSKKKEMKNASSSTKAGAILCMI